ARAELGQHDRLRSGDPLGPAQVRTAPERGPVHHRDVLQPARGKPAGAVERAMSANGFVSPSTGELPAGGAVGGVATDAPLLEVTDLRVDFKHGGRVTRAVD